MVQVFKSYDTRPDDSLVFCIGQIVPCCLLSNKLISQIDFFEQLLNCGFAWLRFFIYLFLEVYAKFIAGVIAFTGYK